MEPRFLLRFLLIISLVSSSESGCHLPYFAKKLPREVEMVKPDEEPFGGLYPELTTLEFYCKKGFTRLSGDEFMTCVDNKWGVFQDDDVKLPTPLRCTKKSCPLIHPGNGTATLKDDNITYTCRPGFRLKGHKRTKCLTDENGNYYVALNPPKCEEIIHCPKAINSRLLYSKTCCLSGKIHNFSCPVGFALKGRSSLKCNNDGKWGGTLPSCIAKIPCNKANIPGLKFAKHCCYADEVYAFSCSSGWKLEGNAKLKCDKNGQWMGLLPYCKQLSKCGDPGFTSFATRSGNCCTENSRLTFICHDGYELLNKASGNSISCKTDGKWNRSKPLCKPKDRNICPFPPPENNLEVESGQDEHPDLILSGQLIDFKCRDSFYTNSSSSLSLLCEEDGKWEEEFPLCFPKSPCSMPRIPANGRIKELINNNKSTFPIGFEINIECDDGFRIPSRIYGIRCIGTKWQQMISDCLPIICSDPGIPKHGMRSGDSFLHGSKMIFACMPGFTLIGDSERVCQKNGRWSGHTTVCDAGDSTCPDPGVPQNSYRKGNSFNAGDVVVYGCRDGATLFGNGTRVCLANGHWSGEEIECSGINEFSDDVDVMTSLDMTMTIVARSAVESPVSISLARSGGKDSFEDVVPVTFFFLVDTSGSITKSEFTKCKQFIKLILQKVGISKSDRGIRASVITFSSVVKVIFYTDIADTSAAIRMIDGMTNDAKGTNINLVLEEVDGLVHGQFRDKKRMRSKSLIFLMSDGKK